jgi:hypothetical protein
MPRKSTCKYLAEPVAHILAWREHIWMCEAYGIVRRAA